MPAFAATAKVPGMFSIVSTTTSSYTVSLSAAALEAAAKLAPSEEFVVSIHEESEDQFLGSVRHQAASLSDQTIDSETLEALYDDEEEADEL